MRTYIVTSYTNYGETITIFNAANEEVARDLADNHPTVWEGYDIEELDTSKYGEVFFGGGDGG